MVLDIITYTDFAGAIDETYHCPGAARLSGLFQLIRSENPEGTLLLDAGDILCGAPICNLTAGEPVVEVLNHFGIDVMTMGNHEFDNGEETMTRVLSAAKFPILCANILSEKTGGLLPFAREWVMLERGGVKIGVVGVTTEYTPYMVKADKFVGYKVLPPADVLNMLIPKIREAGADIVVVLGHLPGNESENGIDGELGEVHRAIAPVDVMIGGHNLGDVACVEGNTIFAKVGFSAAKVARISLNLDENKKITDRSVRIYDMMAEEGQSIEKDAEMQALVDSLMEPYRPALYEPLAELPVRLDVSRDDECALGNFYTAGLAAAGKAEIGMFNATSIFGYMPAGTVTAEMVTHVMCFDEDVFVGNMSGELLYRFFERTYEDEHFRLNGAMQFSGLRLVVDTGRPEGERVISLCLSDGSVVERDKFYRVATTDYIAFGGNDYGEIMKCVDWENTHVRTHKFFVDYLRERGVLPHETDGRITNQGI